MNMFLKNNKRTTKLIRKSRALRVVESAMQLELSSRTETEQEARSKSSCYNFETLSTQIFQCNCFFLLPLAYHQAIVRGATVVGNASHKGLKSFLEEYS